LAWSAWRHSPTADEPAHLASGLTHWQFGRLEAYRVNPPLVRTVAAVPIWLAGTHVGLRSHGGHAAGSRSEFALGSQLLKQLGTQAIRWFGVARWACLPFCLLGLWICFLWSSDLYGRRAGLLAAVLWCFSPTLLGHGALMTPDVASASLAALSGYLLWRWLRTPDWEHAFCAGVGLGVALLTKGTLVVLPFLSLLIWIVYHGLSWSVIRSQTPQVLGLLALALIVLNLGYGLEGSGTRVRGYEFVSQALTGHERLDPTATTTGNRFARTCLGNLPVPLPKNYVLGMDRQRHDIECRKWSYLAGEWRWGGWWYYYLYALAVKEPLALWCLGVVAWGRTGRSRTAQWRDEFVLLCPLVAILLLVSSQTGFNHHPRYLLPIYPFLFIWVSRVAAVRDSRGQLDLLRQAAIVGLLVWYGVSSLFAYPHSLSYFNELAGGPHGGPRHLLASNTDWGQDLIYLREWLDENPEVKDYRLAWANPLVDPAIVGIEADEPPTLEEWRRKLTEPWPDNHWSEWHLLSVNEIHAQHGKFAYFCRLVPAQTIGYSLYAYRLEADDVRRLLDDPAARR